MSQGTLARIQDEFARALLFGDEAAAARLVDDGLPAAARLQIHRNHLFHSLTQALMQTFATVERLVGERFFAGLARAYIAEQPPRSPCLFEYGEGFADLIARHPACAALPYLADVARFDFAVNLAWNAPDRPAIGLDGLARLDAESLAGARLALTPSLSLLHSDYPLAAIWRANHRPRGEEEGVDLDAGGGRFMIWRLEGEAAWRELAPADFAFLQSLADGHCLGEAAEAAGASGPFDLAAALSLLAGQGILIGFRNAVARMSSVINGDVS
ncbi:MAG: putative DNA-binding domain-containing protein [Alphaproteobacteria bacterium]|nr:putative DNA-binding domain-containing protein [Alphaproteobacteria bacterium]